MVFNGAFYETTSVMTVCNLLRLRLKQDICIATCPE